MARRRAAPKRTISPDPLFGSEQLARFINCVMLDGKKSVAQNIVYGALERVAIQLSAQQSTIGDAVANSAAKGASAAKAVKVSTSTSIHEDAAMRTLALEKLEEAFDKITPLVEVKARRVGGATYQVPMEVPPRRRMALAMRWLVEFSNKRSEKTMVLRLSAEILDALQERGGAFKRREEMHRMAKANQVFAHYRW